MAILLDKEGLQNYANKMVLAENRKVGSKSLPSALADVDKLIEEMKGQFEAEYGSALEMKLENNENIFSVGTGSGIDRRGEVENSFTDIEVFGDSAVNLCVRTPQTALFGTSGSGTETFTMSTNENYCTYTTNNPTKKYVTVRLGSEKLMKATTKYTLVFTIKENTVQDWQKGITIAGANDPHYTTLVNRLYHSTTFAATTGVHKIIFSTGDDVSTYTGFGFGFHEVITTVDGQKFTIGDVMLLEGDYTNKPLPQYFEGLKSVGEEEDRNEIEVLSIGKNLFNISKMKNYENDFHKISKDEKNVVTMTGKRTDNKEAVSGTKVLDCPIHLIKGRIYTASFDADGEMGEVGGSKTCEMFWMLEGSATRPYVNVTGARTWACAETGYYHPRFDVNDGKSTFKFWNIQVEENNTKTPYEPYISDKKLIPLNEPLRGLPNGVKDAIEKVSGEWRLIRRCGGLIIDGSDDENIPQPASDLGNTVSITLPNPVPNSVKSGTIGYTTHGIFVPSGASVNDYELVQIYDNKLIIRILKNKLATIDLLGVKQFLSKNPVKITYLLETPIIEDIEPITLQCWKNGTISIDSTVPPTTTHTVALNKPAQIKRNIEELTALRHKVKTLEEQYDQIALEQAHKLQLLNHSIELEGKR